MIKIGLFSAWLRHPSWWAKARLRRLPRQTKNILDFYSIISIEDKYKR
jgi:hypothetical protein